MKKLTIVVGVMAVLNLAVLGHLALAGQGEEKPIATATKDCPVAGQGTTASMASPHARAIEGSAPAQPHLQAFLDPRSQDKIIRLGIQKNDCGCCQGLKEQLHEAGFQAEFSYLTPSNDIVITEHNDRCRVVNIDGVPFSGYTTQELGKIVAMKFRGDLPGPLAHTKNTDGVDPREARPYPGERSLIVVEHGGALGGQ